MNKLGDWNEYIGNLTLDNATQIIKQNIAAIKKELGNARRNYVSVGFHLRCIDENKLYEEAGYKSAVDYAVKELEMSKSSYYLSIQINKGCSVGGFSPVVEEKFMEFSESKLKELISLPEEKQEQVTPEMTVKQIREMKPKKAKTAPEREVATSQIEKVVGEVVEPEHNEPEQKKMCFFNPSSECNIVGCSEVAKGLGINCYGICCHGCDFNDECGARCNNSRLDDEPCITEQEYDFDKASAYTIADVERKLYDAKINCDGLAKEKTEAPICKTERMKVDAFELLLNQMKRSKAPEVTQPELPILKNNDQRKEFIDNYTNWPLWIDQTLTGERYYRYDFNDIVAIVVKVSCRHAWKDYKPSKSCEYGCEEYYLLGISSNYGQSTMFEIDCGKTFYECSTNKSALVDFLKEWQKGTVK